MDVVEFLDMEPINDFAKNVVNVHFGKETRPRVRARKFLIFVILPFLYISLTILSAIKDCIFAKAVKTEEETEKATTPTKAAKKNSPNKNSREKID